MLHEWQQDFVRCLRDPRSVPAALQHNKRRFATYRDSVTASLVTALGDAFPVNTRGRKTERRAKDRRRH